MSSIIKETDLMTLFCYYYIYTYSCC